MKPLVRATPFHSRAAAFNRDNAWINRNGFTLAAHYTDAQDEALAARLRVAIADISWRWRLVFEGPEAGDLLQKLVSKDPAKLVPGQGLKALWLSEGGALRGTGLVARYGRENFVLVSAAPDPEWIEAAALAAKAQVRDASEQSGALAIVGPYAAKLLLEAGIHPALEALHFRGVFWRGLDVTLSRWGEHGGYELWCKPDDAPIVWDRLMRAGEAFGIAPAGVDAMDILDLEAGIARPVRDYDPALARDAIAPAPRTLGLESLIDSGHADFIGRRAWMKAREAETRVLIGLEIEAGEPAPHSPVRAGEEAVGQVLASCHSPALRRAIALAQIDAPHAEPGTTVSVVLPATRQNPEFRNVAAQVAALPFLPAPDLLPP
ncbi:MAG TPA: aminomethyltransferase family protein [Rhizomicrobium sp.]|jgi:aminomethyltransferase